MTLLIGVQADVDALASKPTWGTGVHAHVKASEGGKRKAPRKPNYFPVETIDLAHFQPNMTIVTKYRVERNRDENVFYVRAGEKIPCPCCGGELRPRGWPKRGLHMADGRHLKLRVRRRKCRDCGSWHRELPETIVPYKRLCLETIELIINNEEQLVDMEQEEETFRRVRKWWALMLPYIAGALAAIKEKYGEDLSHLSPAKNLAKIVRALANSQMWPCTRSVLMAVP